MTETINLEHRNGETLIRIPMKLKKRGGRKEVIVADGLAERTAKADMDMPFVIALARAHAWQELLSSGKYRSVREMAKDLGICHTYMARLLRWTILAPDIIESILEGHEPDGLSQTKLTGAIPADWTKQRERCGPKPGSRRPSLNRAGHAKLSGQIDCMTCENPKSQASPAPTTGRNCSMRTTLAPSPTWPARSD